MPDFISQFLDWSKDIPSPEIFRLWSAIATVAAACERRIYMRTQSASGQLYPNLYVLQIAGPACGKTQGIEVAEDLVRATRKLHVAAHGTSKAALLDQLEAASRKIPIMGGAALLEYHSLFVVSPEFGVLIPEHDMAFLSVLNDIFDNRATFKDVKRTTKSVDIAFPQLNILAATQPGYLANLLPETAWSMGFMSRIIMIYASKGPKVDFFGKTDRKPLSPLQDSLNAMIRPVGEISLTSEAMEIAWEWMDSGQPPIPSHSKLVYYNGRRNIFFAKLMIISAVSRQEELQILPSDVIRAREWLLQAEHFMPDVFREMVQKNDSLLILELHTFLTTLYAKERKPIHESRLIEFLYQRMPHDKVMMLIDIARRSTIIEEIPGTKTYKPRPRHNHGVE